MQPTDIAELRRLWEAGQEPNKHWADNLYRIYSAIPALRAELAKEKANASLVGTWEQAARKAAGEDGVQFVGPNTIFAVSDKLRADRDRLAADNARLRAALEEVRTHYPEDYKVRITEIIDAALAATPAREESESKNGEENDRQNQDNKCIG